MEMHYQYLGALGVHEDADVGRRWRGGEHLPMLPPAAVRPVAKARRLVKYVATMAILGKYIQPQPMPTTTPWAKNTW